ncbi:Uma2 family endonuclease [Streptomyces sp. AV19]|uniref:Uma2 family endonuclease n=1 Tax=Streptomyces sp. AV19 TaxID=2793068 RepID=UPI0018FE6536|nr:Uma2 family endonuclease [Streptomyces sp. AV19]MBH1938494.1 Uma2 family endonuclease [Streptomyces sp. AV19]MDG4535143.1 Uma2 family endonuclease [Streptomyces sp. AV19]
MSTQPHTYAPGDPETALKYAIQHLEWDRVQIVEGIIQPLSPTWGHEKASPTWGHEKAITKIRRQVEPVADKLGCFAGSGNIDLPGTSNWYVPDLAIVPEDLSGEDALLPDQTLLVVEVTSDSNGDTDRVVKRRRYAEYGAPLYLLVDRRERSCTLFSDPGELGYMKADGPRPFGTPMHLPEPFELALDTSEF